tara:strand:- start:3223 stop:3726 length:504 start_codon:yes stop_codon:yes gene_type:complete
MKLLIKFCAVAILLFTACKEVKTTGKEVIKDTLAFQSFGDIITAENVLSSEEVFLQMKVLKVGDTLPIKFTSIIKEVCTSKGCWMKLPLSETEETMVRFKDYGFFMPLDSEGKEVIVEGVAFVKHTSVEELQHYAKDAGKSTEEIAEITIPERTFAFEANGVLLKTK